MTPKAIGYARLSREEIKDGVPITEKLEERARQVRSIAERNGLELIEIIQETASGSTIAGRPGMLRLLSLCESGDCTHVVTTEQARLLRGDKRDEATVEECFMTAGIVLISNEGILDFGEKEFDPFPYEVRLLIGRAELRAYRRRRRGANAQRLRENKRSGGRTPYGYAADPDSPGGYRIIREEYAILKQIFKWHCEEGRSLNWIRKRLNEDGIGTHAGREWSRQVLHEMILNPFYAGRHSHRYTVAPNKRKKRMPISEWDVSPVAGEWVHPLTYDEWLVLKHRYSSDRIVYCAAGLCSGILYDQAGHKMISNSDAYLCLKRDEGRHRGQSILKEYVDRYVVEIVRCVLTSLPDNALADFTAPKKSRADLLSSHSRAVAATKKARNTLEDLLTRAMHYQDLFGSATYESVVRRERANLEALEAAESAAYAALREPAPDDALELIGAVKHYGFDAFWSRLDTLERRRAVIRDIVTRLDIAPRERKWTQQVNVTLAPWLNRYRIVLPKFKGRWMK